MKEQHLQTIREACIETIEDMKLEQIGKENFRREFVARYRPIRLADVLLALETKSKQDPLNEYQSLHDRHGVTATLRLWNLRKDNLTEQSDGCLEFLAQLLK